MAERKIDLAKRKTLTFQEIQEVYGVSVETLRKWTKRRGEDGKPALPSYRPGKDHLVYVSDFEAYVKRFPQGA